jgi:hypothetical protein
VILFLLFTNDVTICMELDPGIHIGSTWFVLETGCDRSSTVVAPAPTMAPTALRLDEDTSWCCCSWDTTHRWSPRPLLIGLAGRASGFDAGTSDSPIDSSTLLVLESVPPATGTGVAKW